MTKKRTEILYTRPPPDPKAFVYKSCMAIDLAEVWLESTILVSVCTSNYVFSSSHHKRSDIPITDSKSALTAKTVSPIERPQTHGLLSFDAADCVLPSPGWVKSVVIYLAGKRFTPLAWVLLFSSPQFVDGIMTIVWDSNGILELPGMNYRGYPPLL
jgi:hypothetical protein